MNLLDQVIADSEAKRNGPQVVRENHDKSTINWRAGLKDPCEMAGGGAVDAANRMASLAEKNGKINLVYAGKMPWHELGIGVSEAMDSEQALQLGGLAGWKLQKMRNYVLLGAGDEARVNTRLIESDSWSVVRRDTNTVLGTVGDRYTIVSNEECFNFVDDVLKGTGAKYHVAGALNEGRQVFLVSDVSTWEVAPGDPMEQYLTFATSHDGSGAIRLFDSEVRTVCKNTYTRAWGKKRKSISIRHTQNYTAKIVQARRALGVARRTHEAFVEQAEGLASVKLSSDTEYFAACLDDIVNVTVADQRVTEQSIKNGTVLDAIVALTAAERQTEEKKLDRAITRRRQLLDDIIERHESERCNGHPAIAGTAWSAVNAVTEAIDHGPIMRHHGDDRKRRESRMLSVLDGEAADLKERALGHAVNMAT